MRPPPPPFRSRRADWRELDRLQSTGLVAPTHQSPLWKRYRLLEGSIYTMPFHPHSSPMTRKPPQTALPLGILAIAILTFASPAPVAGAEKYPARPIRLIVPFAPGGGTDMVARVIAPKLSERLGTSVVVDNRGGAGAVIGTAIAAKAIPDGYTLLVCDTAHTIQPTLQKLEYHPIRSFSLIASLVTGDSMLVTPANVPASSIKEFIALAKKKPGQLV